MKALNKISVFGSGSWATALVKILSESGIKITWYLRSQEHVDYLLANGRNPRYLGFLKLRMEHILPTCELEEAFEASDDLLFAIPSAYLEAELEEADENLLKGKRIYVSIKGTVSENALTPSAFLAKRFFIPEKEILVLGGPCHAEEIAQDRKTYLTIAGKNKEVVSRFIKAIKSEYVKPVANNDPRGVEYAAILKNVIGIVAGIVKGMNYGDNFLAVVVSNSMREIKNFLLKIDNANRDLADSAYFGDLLVTAYSEFSRNRTFGYMIGSGYSVAMAENKMTMTAEGFPAVKGIHQIAGVIGVKMPVLSAVYRMLYRHGSPYTELKLLENQLK